MKTVSTNIALLGLSALVSATQAHVHNHAHAHAHNKRKVITQIDVVTAQAPDVLVYVDENGNTLSIVGGSQPTPASVPNPNPVKNVMVSATPSGGSVIPTFSNGEDIDEGIVGDVTVVQTVTANDPLPTGANLAATLVQAPPAAQQPPIYQAIVPAPARAQPPVWQAPPAQPPSQGPVWQAPQQAPARPQPPQAPAPAPYSPPAYAPPAPYNPPAYSPPAPANGGGNSAVTWSPYTTKGGPCKQLNQAMSDFRRMGSFSTIRIYGTDCDQVNIALKAGAATGKKIFAGIFNINNVAGEANIIINAVRQNGNNWGLIDTVSIGNEDVGTKGRSVDDVASAMSQGIPILRRAGWNGPIVHVDTAGAFMDNNNIRNGICDSDTAGDYIAVNIHPFFNSGTSAQNAGRFVANEVAILKSKCASITGRHHRLAKRDTRVRVTESGWPKAGASNGQAVPGVQNQRIALASLQAAVSDMVLFSAFDAQWQDAGAYGVEPHWGILDS